jgi:7-cyano-7-deazaguanine synthase
MAEAHERAEGSRPNGSALVLFSGGLDSTVCLAMVAASAERVMAVLFDYGQTNRVEIERAHRIAAEIGVPLRVVELPFDWGGSTLLAADSGGTEVRRTFYVPARNLVFLSIAASIAEAEDLDRIYLGANASEQTFRDARPDFLKAFERAANEGLRRAGEGRPISVRAPLAALGKDAVVKAGIRYRAPLHLTWSCYGPGPLPCGACLACGQRQDAFDAAGVADPALEHGRATMRLASCPVPADPLRVVHVVGAPYSGSTVFSLFLGTHPDVFAVGELISLGADLELGVPCTCGVPVALCGYWRAVLDRVGSPTWSDADAMSAAFAEEQGSAPAAAYGAEARALWVAAAAASGCRVVVDASKDPRRVALLGDDPAVRLLHLVRDGRAAIDSMRRHLGADLDATAIAHRWVATQEAARRQCDQRPDSLLVRYEDWCDEPVVATREMARWLGVDELAFGALEQAGVSHHLRGNLSRFDRRALARDDSWRQRVSLDDEEAFLAVAAPTMAALGYPTTPGVLR